MSNTVNNYTETDLGNISLNPRGEYDNSAAYEYLDTVSYRGGSYFCLAELETTITGIAPDAGRDSEHWQMIAAPGDMTPEYTAAYNNVINKAVQVETSRAAVELAQQEIEAVQTDVQQLHSDTVRAAQEARNSKIALRILLRAPNSPERQYLNLSRILMGRLPVLTVECPKRLNSRKKRLILQNNRQ